MLPYEQLWKLIMRIFEDSPAIATSRKYEGYDEELYEELSDKATEYFFSTADHVEGLDELLHEIDSVDFTYRYKSDESIKLKLDRINMKKQLYKIANDIFGMRFVVAANTEELIKITEEFVKHCPMENICNITDQTTGKKNDDGYKGIHVYIRPNNHVFPIEVQFWTRTHALLNQYLHDNIYKMGDENLNQYALDLREWLESVPSFSPGDGLAIKSYVDYIYEQAFSTKVEPAEDIEFDEWLEDDWLEDLEVGDEDE